MSKCDFRIVFDQADRRYRGGEEVTGTVFVAVNEDVESAGVLLEQFWQTHGRGNTATGPKQTRELYRGSLRAGQSLSYPFRFTAPDGPPTYRGRYLNVDHYVHARVDIPWAIDPTLKEEYVLLPGPRRYGNLPASAGSAPRVKSGLAAFGAPVGVGMIVFGLFLFPCGLVLTVLGLVVLLFSARRLLAEKKIGTVRVSWGSLHVPPGGSLPLHIAFTPRRSSRLNRIVAQLVGQERCVSGSGTNRTTHTHKFYERATILAPECDVTAGRPLEVTGLVPIPETSAFSFHASNNDLSWELEVRVDIPLWPDWVAKRTVVVRPAAEPEIVEATVVEEPLPGPFGQVQPARDSRPPEAVPAMPLLSAESPVSPEPEPPTAEEPPAVAPASTDPALVGILERIASADRYSREREEIFKEQAERSFGCAIEVAKIERTYSYIPDQRFRKGRTVTGVLRGTDCEVSVELTEARNEEIDSLKPGSVVQADCRLVKWNTIYDRLEMREA